MLTAAGVSATVGVIGLAAFNSRVSRWLEETTPSGEWGYRQRERFRTYLACALAVAILVPLAIIVGAGPAEIFWLQTLGRPPISYAWSLLIVSALVGGTILIVFWLVVLAMQTGANLAQEIRDQQTLRGGKGTSIPYAGTVASSAESGEGPAAWTAEKSGGPIRPTEAAPSVDDPPSGGQGEGDD